ncbi:tail fiber domain-containing protein [bacterium]|nr:tail fiber domain-containing protein [bacterium]
MKKIYLSITTLVVFAYADVVAQDGMSVGTNATPLEMLDVNGAIRIGNDFTGTAAAPVGGRGTLRWNNSATRFEGWDGTNWVPLSGSVNTDDQTAIEVAVTPNIDLLSTDVQAALEELQLEINGISPTIEDVLTNGDLAADGQNLEIDLVRARDGDGLLLTDDASNGVFIEDGGNVGVGTLNPGFLFDVSGQGLNQGPITTSDNVLARFEQTVNAGAGIQIKGFRNLPFGSSFIDLMNQTSDGGGSEYTLGRVEGVNVDVGSQGALAFYTNNGTALTEQMRINSAGNVGIGITNPTYKLHVNGKIRTNGINETSDGRLKKDVKKILNASELVKALDGVTYYWRTDEFPDMDLDNRLQYGLIAQELEKVIPELVNTDSEGWKSVEYTHLVPILLEALKEQLGTIETLQEENASVSKKLENYASLVSDVERLKEAVGIDKRAEK